MSAQTKLKQVKGDIVGSIPFIGPGGTLIENNSNFFWDNTNNKLGIGTNAPISKFHVPGSVGTTVLGSIADNVGGWFHIATVGGGNGFLFLESGGSSNTVADHRVRVSGGGGGGIVTVCNSSGTGKIELNAYSGSTHLYVQNDTNSGGLEVQSAGDVIAYQNLGVGTALPTAKTHITGIDSLSTSYSLKIDNSASEPLLYVSNDGFVGAGTSTQNSAYSTFSHKAKATQALGYLWADFHSPNGLTGITFKQDADIPSAVDIISGSYNAGFGASILLDGASRQISLGGYPYAGGIVNVNLNYQNRATTEKMTISSGTHTQDSGPKVWFYGAANSASNSQYNYGSIEVLKENATDTDNKAYMKFSISDGSGSLVEVLRISSDKTIQYQDGNQGVGKVLTSDANGVATWQTPGGGGGGISKAAVTFTPGTAGVANTLSHGLGTADIIVQLWDVVTGQVIYADISNATSSQVDITFSVNPSGDVKAIIIG